MKSVPVKTCTNIDCPERTGGNCNAGESVPVKSPEMEYSATYDLSRSVPVEKWKEEFEKLWKYHLDWVGSGFRYNDASLTATGLEETKPKFKALISQAIQAARIEAVEEYKSKNGM